MCGTPRHCRGEPPWYGLTCHKGEGIFILMASVKGFILLVSKARRLLTFPLAAGVSYVIRWSKRGSRPQKLRDDPILCMHFNKTRKKQFKYTART